MIKNRFRPSHDLDSHVIPDLLLLEIVSEKEKKDRCDHFLF